VFLRVPNVHAQRRDRVARPVLFFARTVTRETGRCNVLLASRPRDFSHLRNDDGDSLDG
jgi:hypothetical protein